MASRAAVVLLTICLPSASIRNATTPPTGRPGSPSPTSTTCAGAGSSCRGIDSSPIYLHAVRLKGGTRDGCLHEQWKNSTPGTSPVLAGGLLYVYEPEAGGIEVCSPRSPRPIAELPGSPGHWNSPIVVDDHVVEPEGDANDHSGSGTVDIFTAP